MMKRRKKKAKAKIWGKKEAKMRKAFAGVVKKRKSFPTDAVGAIIVVRTKKEGDKVLMARRRRKNRWGGTWMGGPSESLESKESMKKGLIRGMKEEVGLDITTLDKKTWEPLGRVWDKEHGVRATVFKIVIPEDVYKKQMKRYVDEERELGEVRLEPLNEIKEAAKEGKIKWQPQWGVFMDELLRKSKKRFEELKR